MSGYTTKPPPPPPAWMTTSSGIQAQHCQTWRATMELRWHAWGKGARLKLQQRWVSDQGADEWRDVPTVVGTPAT